MSTVATEKRRRNRRTAEEYMKLDLALFDIVERLRPMTVRGLYYQAEVAGLVGKDEKSYDLVQRRCLKLRRDGIIPYTWITDNSRWVRSIDRYGDHKDFMRSMANLYRRDYWRNEPSRVEVWIEKDALSGVIYEVVVDNWGVDMYVQKGFSSDSYLFSAAEQIKAIGKPTHIYVLSDFDPSGKWSFWKVEPGLKRHLDGAVDVWVHDLAVTPKQIRDWGLPTRPAKTKDNTHWQKFHEVYGDVAHQNCELDAIRPDRLRELCDKAIRRHWSNAYTLAQMRYIEDMERQVIEDMAV